MTATKREFGRHARFDTMAELIFVEERLGITKECVLRLDLDCEIPKGVMSLLHGKELDVGDLLPVFQEETRSEFRHKFSKGEGQNHLAIDGDPVLDAIITKPGQDLANLLIDSDLFAFEETQACIFVLTHHGGCEVTLEKDGDLVQCVLLDNCVFGLRRHHRGVGTRAIRR